MAKPKRKVLVVSDRYERYGSYYSPFEHLGEYTNNTKIIEYAPEQLVCAVFTGGADVDPKHYGQEPCPLTSTNPSRDDYEIEVYKACRRANIPIFGICRGAQLMCVMAGGTLCQHLTSHGYGDHVCMTHTGETVWINSYHHQMMLPPKDAEVLAWCSPKMSRFYLGDAGDDIQVDKEIEVVHFPSINALAVQYHPELHHTWEQGWVYYQDLINEFLYTAQYSGKEGEPPSMLRNIA